MNKQEALEKYGCTEAKFKGRYSSACRKIWMKSKMRSDALKRSRIPWPFKDGSKRKFAETCEKCNKAFEIREKFRPLKKDGELSKELKSCLEVHHLDGVPNVDHPDYFKMLNCDVSRLIVLCYECHIIEHEEMKKNE